MTSTWMQIPSSFFTVHAQVPSLSLWDETRLVKKTERVAEDLPELHEGILGTHHLPALWVPAFHFTSRDEGWPPGMDRAPIFWSSFLLQHLLRSLSVRKKLLLSRLRIYTCLSYRGQDALTFSCSRHLPRHLPPFPSEGPLLPF